MATAVSLIGLKNIEPSDGDTARPMPCEDFLPTSLTGSSVPNDSGPDRNADVCTEKSLMPKKGFHLISNILLHIDGQFAHLSVANG